MYALLPIVSCSCNAIPGPGSFPNPDVESASSLSGPYSVIRASKSIFVSNSNSDSCLQESMSEPKDGNISAGLFTDDMGLQNDTGIVRMRGKSVWNSMTSMVYGVNWRRKGEKEKTAQL